MAGSNTQEATDRVAELKGEIESLEEQEKTIDLHKQVREQKLGLSCSCREFIMRFRGYSKTSRMLLRR